MTCVLIIKGHLDIDTYVGKMSCENEGRSPSDAYISQRMPKIASNASNPPKASERDGMDSSSQALEGINPPITLILYLKGLVSSIKSSREMQL